MLGVLASLVWAFYLISEQTARNWFMHRLTLQDTLDDARGSFGGAHDVDSLCLFSVMAGEPVRPDDLIASELALGAPYDPKLLAQVTAELAARAELATRQPPTDSTH